MSLKDKLLSDIKKMSSQDEQFYIDIREEIKNQPQFSTDIASTSMEIIQAILSGAEKDTLDGLKARLSRLDRVQAYLSDADVGKEELQILGETISKVRRAIGDHYLEKSKTLNKMKGFLAKNGERMADGLLRASGNDFLINVAVAGGKFIKQRRDAKREKLQAQNETAREDAENLLKTQRRQQQIPKKKPSRPGSSNSPFGDSGNSGESESPGLQVASNSDDYGGSGVSSSLQQILQELRPIQDISSNIQKLVNYAERGEIRAKDSAMDAAESALERGKGGIPGMGTGKDGKGSSGRSRSSGLFGDGILGKMLNPLIDGALAGLGGKLFGGLKRGLGKVFSGAGRMFMKVPGMKSIAKGVGGFMRGAGSLFSRGKAGLASGLMRGASGLARGAGGLVRGAGSLLARGGSGILAALPALGGLGAGAAKAVSGIGAKAGAKVAAKGGMKSLLKKIPGLGLLSGGLFAAQRALSGDFSGAALELASGAASTIPGLGTAGSVALDAALAAKDMGAFGGDESAEAPAAEAEPAKAPAGDMKRKLDAAQAKRNALKEKLSKAKGMSSAGRASGGLGSTLLKSLPFLAAGPLGGLAFAGMSGLKSMFGFGSDETQPMPESASDNVWKGGTYEGKSYLVGDKRDDGSVLTDFGPDGAPIWEKDTDKAKEVSEKFGKNIPQEQKIVEGKEKEKDRKETAKLLGETLTKSLSLTPFGMAAEAGKSWWDRMFGGDKKEETAKEQAANAAPGGLSPELGKMLADGQLSALVPIAQFANTSDLNQLLGGDDKGLGLIFPLKALAAFSGGAATPLGNAPGAQPAVESGVPSNVPAGMSDIGNIPRTASGSPVGMGLGTNVARPPGAPAGASATPMLPGAVPSGGTASKDQMKAMALKELQAQGITDPTEQANILANLQAESNFKPQSENLNYSAQTLMKLYGPGSGNKVRVRSMEEAQAIVDKGPEAVGNLVYGGRMGNAADEGYKFRGRGLVQLTGKDNYAAMSKKLGIDLLENPDLANDPAIAAKIQAQYYADRKKTGKFDFKNINDVSKATGHAAGAAENMKRAQLAQQMQADIASGKISADGVVAPESIAPKAPVIQASSEFVVDPDTGEKYYPDAQFLASQNKPQLVPNMTPVSGPASYQTVASKSAPMTPATPQVNVVNNNTNNSMSGGGNSQPQQSSAGGTSSRTPSFTKAAYA